MTGRLFFFIAAGFILTSGIVPLSGKNLDEPVVITGITTEIEGKTRRSSLLRELRIREGEEYESIDELRARMETRTAVLLQRRLFKEFHWEVTSAAPGEAEVVIRLVDSFTLLPRPMVSYASGTGLLLGLKLEYFNALGTLTDETLLGYWSPGETCFRLESRNVGLGPLHFDLVCRQFDGITRYGSPSGDIIAEFRNMHTLVSLTADWPLGATSSWAYLLEPSVMWEYNYRDDFTPAKVYVDPAGGAFDHNYLTPEGFAPGFRHGIHTNQVEWIGNQRKGIDFSLMNKNVWHLDARRYDMTLETDLFGYTPLFPWLEISGRLGGFYAFDGIRENAGDRLRGVIDYMTYGNWGGFATFQADFRVINWQRILEGHFRPFVDIGYVKSELWDHGPDSWEYCTGATLILYIEALPSLVFNIDYGWDFKRSVSELYIDTALLF